jgi:hypothetical protein
LVKGNSAGFPTMAGVLKTFYLNSKKEVAVSTTTNVLV